MSTIARHDEVAHDDVGLDAGEGGQAAARGLGGHDRGAAVLEDGVEQLTRVVVVVDDQHVDTAKQSGIERRSRTHGRVTQPGGKRSP